MTALSPFAKHLPYRTTLQVLVPAALRAVGEHACVLVLKDGTLAVGLAAEGLDVYAASATTLNTHAACLTNALQALPARAFLQTVYESGHTFDALLDGYAAQSDAAAADVLKRGRAERHAMLNNCTELTRCTVTYWLGLKHAVPKMKMKTASKDAAWSQASVQKAAEPLLDAAAAFINAAQRMGLRLDVLRETEVLAALHRAINPSLHHGAPAPGYVDNAVDAEAYAQGAALVLRAPTLAAQLPQSALQYNATQLVCGEPRLVLRALGVSQYGPTTHPQSLHDVLYAHLPKGGPMRLVVTHEATDTGAQREKLTRRQRLISSFVGTRFIDHAAQAALSQHEAVLESLDTRGSRLFDTSITAIVCGPDLDTVERATRDVLDGFSRQRMAATIYRDEQLPAWLASLPAFGHVNPFKHKMLGPNCGHLVPYWIPSQGDRSPDLLFENRQRGLEALSVRLGPVRENAGAIIIGATNSGKTFLFSTLFKYGCLDLGGHVILADIKGPANSSYRPLCELLGGDYVCLHFDRDVSFNPFPPAHEVFDASGTLLNERLEAARRILCMMADFDADAGHDAAYAQSVARDVLERIYTERTAAGEQIVLSDVIDACSEYEGRNETLQRVAFELFQRLELWLDDPVRKRLFNRPIALEVTNRFTVFDFYEMDKDPKMAAVLVSVLASRIEAKMTTLPKNTPKLFGFDEAWALFQQSKEACDLLERLYRVARSYGAFCYILTQGMADIANSTASIGIMANTSLIYLMRHMSQHKDTAQQLELTLRQEELFRSLDMVAGAYAEFLLIDRHEDKTHVLQYAPTAFDLWCDTSRAADVHMRQQVLAKSPPGVAMADVLASLAREFPRGAPYTDVPSNGAETPEAASGAAVATSAVPTQSEQAEQPDETTPREGETNDTDSGDTLGDEADALDLESLSFGEGNPGADADDRHAASGEAL